MEILDEKEQKIVNLIVDKYFDNNSSHKKETSFVRPGADFSEIFMDIDKFYSFGKDYKDYVILLKQDIDKNDTSPIKEKNLKGYNELTIIYLDVLQRLYFLIN